MDRVITQQDSEIYLPDDPYFFVSSVKEVPYTGCISTEQDYIFEEDEIERTARTFFRIDMVRPWQRLVISNILDAEKAFQDKSFSDSKETNDLVVNGRQLVLLPTGAGKSLCFLLPSLLLPGLTIVFYPLIALMTDQKKRMDEAGIKNVLFCGGQSEEDRQKKFQVLKKGAKIVLVNPEILQNNGLLERLSSFFISHIVIDEAHCVSEWGDSFRPAYLGIGQIIKKLEVPLVTAFTATASEIVIKRISDILFAGEVHIIRGECDRPNIFYQVNHAFAKKKELLKLIAQEIRPIVVFCRTRARSEDVAREIAACFSSKIVKFYHAGLEKEEKKQIEKWFYSSTDGILCCTCAFGMGINKKNIRTVIHFDAPLHVESYVQETGRAGRDGKAAKAVLLWNAEDHFMFCHYSPESRESVMLKFAETFDCRRQVLLSALGENLTVCSGCDICKSKTNLPVSLKQKHFPYFEIAQPAFDYTVSSINRAFDAEYILAIVKKYRKFFQEDSLCS